MIATESNTLSPIGSIRLCINSLTETIGFMAPQSAGSGLVPGGALAVDAVEAGDEQDAANEARVISPAAAIRFRARNAAISAPVQACSRGTTPHGRRTFESRAARSYQRRAGRL